jgi:D-serine deaminase-like pyridoxal phosphate-dependent protein
MWHLHEGGVATEHRAGTYVYNDRSLVAYGTCDEDDCALTVLTTVISTPRRDRIVVDAGSKSLTSDTLGLDGHGTVARYPGLRIGPLSEEHGVIHAQGADPVPRLAERLRIIPNHACVVSNLFDAVHMVRGERVEMTLPVAARGRVT